MPGLSRRLVCAVRVAAILFSAGLPFAGHAQTTQASSARAARTISKLPLSFEPNRGQVDPQVQFIAHSPSANVYLTGSDAVLQSSQLRKDKHGVAYVAEANSVRMHLLGAAAQPAAEGSAQRSGTVNYLRGRDRTQWQTGIPTFGEVRLKSVYPGIDLKYYGNGSQLEYDFIVAPGADASAVKLSFQGAMPHIQANGDLALEEKAQELRFNRPVAWQTVDGRRVPVDAGFAMAKNHEVTFQIGAYDHSRELTIDPTLLYLGTLGAGVYPYNNMVSQIAVDSTGALYFIGTTQDPTYPVTSGAYQTTCGPANATAAAAGVSYCSGGANTSAYITKLSPDGTQLVYSTYLSGHGSNESGTSIAVDSQGVAYVLGQTASNDFPVTANAFQKTCTAYYGFNGIHTNLVPCDGFYDGGGTEYTALNSIAFFAKLNASGTSLLYSSYLGGTAGVTPIATALDSAGNWYIATQTGVFNAADLAGGTVNQGQIQYPGITATGYQTISTSSNGSIANAVALSKFSNDGTTLLYGTFFSDNTNGVNVIPTSLAVGSNGIAFVAGTTDATALPTTPGAVKTACIQPGSNTADCDTYDGFVASFDTTQSGAASLVYSTRLGGTTPTQGSNTPEQVVYGIYADPSNDLYATGYSMDPTFPVGSGGYESSCPAGCGTGFAFVLKLNPGGTQLLNGSFLGGNNGVETRGLSVALDSNGKVYVYGSAGLGGAEFPQVNPLPNNNGANDIFVSTFSADMSQLIFSTLFTNPSYPDHSVSPGGGLVLDPSNNVYFTGTTTDGTFAGTSGTYNTSTSGTGGAHTFFAKLSPVLEPDTTTLTITPATVVTGASVTLKAVVQGTLQTTPVPTGTVTFTATSSTPPVVLGTATLDSTGTATLTVTAPSTAGSYTVAASYGADSVYDVSTSAAGTVTVNTGIATTTTLIAQPSSAKLGTPVVLTATIAESGGTPTGTVTFLDGTTTLSTQPVANGSASYSTSTLSAGTHMIAASYSGDSASSPSVSAAQTVTISANTVTVGLAASPTIVATGGAVGLTATLGSPSSTTAPTGSVTFYSGNTALGTSNLSGLTATLSTSALPAGADSVTAVYSGDSLYGSATSAAQTVVVRAAAATTTALTSSASSAGVGSAVTFTATVSSQVSSGSPTGTVTFSDGSTVLGTGTVSEGVATYTTSSLAAGSHSITAAYSGDSLFLASTSSAFAETVVQPSITMAASPASLTIQHGKSGTVTITVTPSGGYTGTLTFTCGSLPASASCTFSPASLTFSGAAAAQSTTLVVSTAGATVSSLRREGLPQPASEDRLALLFFPLGLIGLAVRRKSSRRAGLFLCLFVAGLLTVAISGCGSSSNSQSTPPGTYSLKVDATAAGSVTSINLPLTVQ